MDASPVIAALVLADVPRPGPEGPPPALRLHNGNSMLSLAVTAFRTAGVGDVRVVTTHDQPDIIRESERCAGTTLVNADCPRGLIPLLCTGIADLLQKAEEPEDPDAPMLAPETALPPAVDAFFALPVQRARLHPDSIAALYRAWMQLPPPERSRAFILSAYAGRCGQLLLIGADHIYPLLQWQGDGQWQDQWQWRGGMLHYAASFLREPEAQRLLEGIAGSCLHDRMPSEAVFFAAKRPDIHVGFVPLDDPHLLGRQSNARPPS